MYSQFKKKLRTSILNLPGWRTDRKIVVIESDDWGSIRMSSKDSFKRLLKKGYPVDKCPYNSNDSLESDQDLQLLFETLNSVKDKNGNPAVLTVFNIVANPDFEKIRGSNFQNYFFEPFNKTLMRYPSHDNVMRLYKEGIDSKIIKPQFHGREHLNITRWMNALQRNDKPVIDAFEEGIFSPKVAHTTGYTNEYMDALDLDDKKEIELHKRIITEGLELFKKIWGFSSSSFTATCYIWHSDLEETLLQNNIKYISGLINQIEPEPSNKKGYKLKYHYQGKKNKLGQRFIIRNAFFEPTINPNFDWEDDCLSRISTAFRWKKPAVISSHRLNYIGYLNPGNRDSNLIGLKNLLNRILKNWPDVEFMTSDQLGKLMDTE